MEAISRLVMEVARDDGPEQPSSVDRYLTQIREEQHRYLTVLAEAASQLEDEAGQVANVAALHGRLSQQMFDAQRLILKRRADAHAAVVRITAEAENEVDTILHGTRHDARGAGDKIHDELGIWAASDGFARSIDRAFDREADGVAAARQLRELLDEWWRVENQEDQAAIDDASARAAMRIHLAEIEAREIGTLRDADDAEAATHWPLRAPISMPVPITVTVTAPVAPRPAVSTAPMLAALDAADHEDLDSVLASLFDALGQVAPAGPVDVVAPPPPMIELAPVEVDPPAEPVTNELRIRCDVAEIEHGETVRQEAFDRFWGAFSAVRSKPLSRDWILVQVMLPAVGVIAVLALVLAWVG